jgi:hypothetical protein
MSAWNFDEETRVAVVGDLHGNTRWTGRMIPAIGRLAADVGSILQVGDLGIAKDDAFLKTVDYWCSRANVDRVIVTLGNHEYWPRADAAFADAPGLPVQLSDSTWVLPRVFRFTVGKRTVLSVAGAASLDREDRVENVNWFASEMPTEADVQGAIAGGPVDLMLSHETIDGGVPLVDRVLRSNPLGWPTATLAASTLSRQRVTRVWEAVRPRVLAHGHMHVAGEAELSDGRRVYSLGCDGQKQNVGVLDLPDLSWEWLDF